MHNFYEEYIIQLNQLCTHTILKQLAGLWEVLSLFT